MTVDYSHRLVVFGGMDDSHYISGVPYRLEIDPDDARKLNEAAMDKSKEEMAVEKENEVDVDREESSFSDTHFSRISTVRGTRSKRISEISESDKLALKQLAKKNNGMSESQLIAQIKSDKEKSKNLESKPSFVSFLPLPNAFSMKDLNHIVKLGLMVKNNQKRQSKVLTPLQKEIREKRNEDEEN